MSFFYYAALSLLVPGSHAVLESVSYSINMAIC